MSLKLLVITEDVNFQKVSISKNSWQKNKVHLLGTIFNGGLIHLWCSSEYFKQRDGVCVIKSK